MYDIWVYGQIGGSVYMTSGCTVILEVLYVGYLGVWSYRGSICMKVLEIMVCGLICIVCRVADIGKLP